MGIPVLRVSIADGTTLEIRKRDKGEVTFAGPTGTLVLDHANTFTGTVVGFGAQDQIDVLSLPFITSMTVGYSENSTQTGGKLTLNDGGHSANIALLGNYTAASFSVSQDGHGGTLITEAPQTSNRQLSLTTTHNTG